jgi:lipopolysaccharide transport system ATP-binding protein
MTNSAISIRNLGKQYLIGANRQRGYRTLRESVSEAFKAPFQMIRQGGALGRTEEFWALRNLSFNVDHGEVVGIIGRNGAGKSTLLKILSGITPPSTGRAILSGRVGSLLEVGTGFHQELSGRENIYLNGSILGMRRLEIASKFDAIVDYSGVEQFLDTPVKRYSSGMRVRLAFAVAAFLEPEILIVDEVLAVGDMEFQKKCLGTMTSVAASGRTVLFVSHNMAAVSSLCNRTLVLSKGSVAYDGTTPEGITQYNNLAGTAGCGATLPIRMDQFAINQFQLSTSTNHNSNTFMMGEALSLNVSVSVAKHLPDLHLLMVLTRVSDQLRVASITTREIECGALSPGHHDLHCRLNKTSLLPGEYTWTLRFVSGEGIHAEADGLGHFSVTERILPGASHPFRQAHGVCHISDHIEHKTRPFDTQDLIPKRCA